MENVSAKEKLLKENNKKGLFDKAKENLLELKSRAEAEAQKWKAELESKGKVFLEMKIKAEGEAKRLRDQLDEKIQALRGKMTELDEYKKAAEGKLFELEAKVKEYSAKFWDDRKGKGGADNGSRKSSHFDRTRGESG